MPNKKRELWADYAKGLCILLVFIGHLNELPQIIRVFIYLFHMPVFFFCMGFYMNTSTDFKSYLKKKASQLLVPFYAYCIWSIARSTLKQAMSSQVNLGKIGKNLIGILINHRASAYPAVRWFLIASFVVCIYYYLLRRYVNHIKTELIIVVGMSILFTYLSRFLNVALPWYLDVAFPCLLFVYLGAVVKKNGIPFAGKHALLWGVIGIACTGPVYTLLAQDEGKYLIDYHMLKLFPYSLVTIGGISLCLFIYVNFSGLERKSFLSYIGENSLIYYLFDDIPIPFVRTILQQLQITNVYVSVCAQLLGIIIFTPFIVMFIKCFFWFLIGKKKEPWSIDYARLIRHR